MSDIEKSVTRIIETYKSAVFAKDVTTLMRLYAPKVRVFDTWGIWSYEGAEAWQRAVEAWFTSLGAGQVRVAFEDVTVVEARDAAFLSAFVTYEEIPAAGGEARSLQNRLSWGLQTSGHALRIVHEHTSAPIGFEDRKAILRRTANS